MLIIIKRRAFARRLLRVCSIV